MRPSLNSSQLNEVVSFVGLSVKATALIVLGVYDNFWDVSVGQFKYPRHLLVVVPHEKETHYNHYSSQAYSFVCPAFSVHSINFRHGMVKTTQPIGEKPQIEIWSPL